MRLWSVHPRYLDAKGLVALWREGLLAQKVLSGETGGYRHHPQLRRFNDADDPLAAIGTYLHHVHKESLRRGYQFDATKIGEVDLNLRLEVTSRQLSYEACHLLEKLKVRDPSRYSTLKAIGDVEVHSSFNVVAGEIADWEITSQPCAELLVPR